MFLKEAFRVFFLIFFKIYYSSISIKEKNKKRDRYRRLTSWQNNEGECKYFIIPTVKFSSNHVELLEKLTGEKEKKTKQKEVIIGNKPRAEPCMPPTLTINKG